MKFIKNIGLIFIAIFAFSCADLDELAPINSIPAGEAINNKATAQAAVNGIYDALQDDAMAFDGWLALPQFFSDEANATGTFPTRLEFGNLNVFPANSTAAGVFTQLYEIINNANNVIANVPNVEADAFSEIEKTDLVAQAKFMRAHAYLHLVTLWQDVPLVLTPTTDISESLNVTKSSVSDIYTQIVSDFEAAARDLISETGSNFASKQAANAFLARVALYQGNWSEALSKAQSVVGVGFDLTVVPYLQDQIYSLAFTPTDGNVLNFFYGPEDTGGRYSIGPTSTIINAFEEGDLRFAMSLDTSSYSVPVGVKYPSFSAGISGTATDPIFFIRHAEMVLIAAEAAAEMGDFTTATMYINQVRNRAGLGDISLDASNFVNMILQERFVEFAFEGPFRLIDLRRKGKAIETLGPIGYDDCDDVWPLPQRDIDRNVNLNQNDCCNC